ncbi:uncharacterized protein LOC118644304 isoform X2 [Monomorium pharaonis]|uniref:uncharacterized protein LOC118644304 isoform X2 n=1 Tax=Monomorium pharaonis TaxID=307658 RepID=UPI001746763F|nr:uncharacterized protein LOC118644304 isoform X2 [Monomorium pharaonis]
MEHSERYRWRSKLSGERPQQRGRAVKRAGPTTNRRGLGEGADPCNGLRVVGAIRPILAEWLDRRHGAPTFRLMLTGHECLRDFSYLSTW